jgi:hypothetical protein
LDWATNLSSAKSTDEFNQKFNGNRVSALRVDVVASSTTDYVENVAKAAGIDYLDTQMSTLDKTKTLETRRYATLLYYLNQKLI